MWTMWRVRRNALGSFLAVACLVWTACSSPLPAGHEEPNEMNVEDGRKHLKSILDGTHRATAAELPLKDHVVIGPSECRDASNIGFGTYFTTVAFDIQLEGRDGLQLLQAIQAHWAERGYDIDTGRLGSSQPELLGASDGFTFRALAVPGSGWVNLAGDTPCLAKAEGVGVENR